MKKVIFSEDAPKPIGPYSQAIKTGELLFVSGQIPLDPKTGQMATGDTEAQTRLVLKNIEVILQKAGASLDKVIKATIFLRNMNDFDRVNKIYEEHFQSDPPARSVIEVSKLPKNADIEIEVIASV